MELVVHLLYLSNPVVYYLTTLCQMQRMASKVVNLKDGEEVVMAYFRVIS
jgi:hypothetical protein